MPGSEACYWDDALVQLGVAPIEYTIEVTVQEGKITASTITTTPESVAKIQEAISRLPPAGAVPGPDAVVKALEAAANAHDVDGATALFTDDAVIQIRPEVVGETYTGKEQIRRWFEGLYADNFHVTVSVTNVQGEAVTTRSSISSNGLRSLGLTSLEGVEQYTVQNGKITGFTFTYTDDSVGRLQSALAPRTLPSTGSPETLPALWLFLLAVTGIFVGASLWSFASLATRRGSPDDRLQG